MVCKIERIPAISAIYFALLQCGYDYYSFERDAAHIAAVERYIGMEKSPSFFSEVRRASCEVYPFWPRAAILETAAFFLGASFDRFEDPASLVKRIESAKNIAPEEKGASLWKWLKGFPEAIKDVMNRDGFRHYLEWENEWIAEQSKTHCGELDLLEETLQICRERYRAPFQDLRVVLNPIKCVYSSDHYVCGDAFIFTSGAMRTESVIHEYLHTVVHPVLERETIAVRKAKYPEIDESYYLDGGESGYRNAFEEYVVRMLTQLVMKREYPSDIVSYMRDLAETVS